MALQPLAQCPSPSTDMANGGLGGVLSYAIQHLTDSETSSFIFITTLVNRCHCSHFTHEKMEGLNNLPKANLKTGAHPTTSQLFFVCFYVVCFCFPFG